MGCSISVPSFRLLPVFHAEDFPRPGRPAAAASSVPDGCQPGQTAGTRLRRCCAQTGSGSKRAALGLGHIRRAAGDGLQALALILGQAGDGGQQAHGVGVQRVFKQIVDLRFLHHKAAVQNNNAVAQLSHNAQVMGDKDDAGAVFLLQERICFKIWCWMVTSRAVVARPQSAGRGGWPAPWRS